MFKTFGTGKYYTKSGMYRTVARKEGEIENVKMKIKNLSDIV